MPAPSVTEARAVFGDELLGPQEVEQVFAVAGAAIAIPFSSDELHRARQAGAMLVLRVKQTANAAPLTVLQMLQRFPDAFDKRLLRQVGYQLKDDWGIELEPLAATETCASGWALVQKDVLDDTRNLSYEEQDGAIALYAAVLHAPSAAVRRRSAVEIVYDTLLYFGARRVRLLEKSWDWSGSRTVDGGYLNVGGFATSGLQVLSFSRAVRHGGLGVCPAWQPVEA